MDKSKRYVVIGDDDAKAKSHAEVLRAAGMVVVRTGRWAGRKGQILFVRRSDTGEEWSLSRFSLDAEVVAVGGWHEMTAMLPPEATAHTVFVVDEHKPTTWEEKEFGRVSFPPKPRAESLTAAVMVNANRRPLLSNNFPFNRAFVDMCLASSIHRPVPAGLGRDEPYSDLPKPDINRTVG